MSGCDICGCKECCGASLGPSAERLERQRDQLLEALNEAKYLIADWGAYASPYFQEKHDLSGDIAKIEAVIAAVEAGK